MQQNQKDILGHPKGLFVLFFSEMWERFSYYGMRMLLVLYMMKYLFLHIEQGQQVFGFSFLRSMLEYYGPLSSQALSSRIYGLYTGFVYFTPFFGGILADRYIGQKRSVYLGGIIMAIGHFLMAVEGLFLLALLFLIVGNGFFKPNISTQVGGLYPAGDHRRDRAFTIFYMGINLGAFFSPLICGTLGQKVGWHYGFAAAGVGMLLGLVVYHFGQKHLPAEPVKKAIVKAAVQEKLAADDKKKVLALVFLCVINILFWGVFEQQGNTLQLWSDQSTDWHLLGFEIPSTWFQMFNPLFIFIFAPVLDRFWAWQDKKGKEPGSVGKMAIGCFLAAFAFLFMMYAAQVVGQGKGSVLWLVGTVFLFTIGELYLSPIGLSLVTKLAPTRLVSTLMGMWFFSTFFGNILAGYIGSYYEALGQMHFFLVIAAMAAAAGLLFSLALLPLRKIISD